MKILIITWNYYPKVGGIELMLKEFVSNWRNYNHVDVIAPSDDKCYKITEPQTYRTKSNQLFIFFFQALLQGISLLKKNEYDIIISGSSLVSPIVFFLGMIGKKPIVVNVYGLDLIYQNSLYQGMIKIFLPKFDVVVAISQATKIEATRKRIDAKKIIIIHPGVDVDEFNKPPDIEEIKNKYNLSDKLVLLSVGRLAKRKGILEFVRNSLPDIIQRCKNVIFLIVGGNPIDSLTHKDDIYSCIKTEINNLGLENHVALLGKLERDELVKIYNSSDIYVLPAIFVEGDMEGFGIVLLEAAAAGIPVVSTRLGGITDAVEEGVSGILNEPGDWQGVTTSIITLIENQTLRKKLGSSGRDRVRKQFSWPYLAAEYLREVKFSIFLDQSDS